MKILWRGNIFNPTGLATANREIVKALLKLDAKIQASDIWHDGYDFNKGLDKLNNPLNFNPGSGDLVTIFADYPQNWIEGFGKLYGYFLHEGTRLLPGWNNLINRAIKVFVPSEATKNLFKWNDVVIPIEVIPYGTNPEIYKPSTDPSGTFVFLSVNSWTGNEGDRKGTDLLIKAFDEEFKEEDVRLVLKIGTFWQKPIDYEAAVLNILGHKNEKIIVNFKYTPEEELVNFYHKANCFVAPTKGESFGLTIINAMACGMPVIVTKDINSGHMDYCKNKDSILWIDAPTVSQGDRRFFAEGNMLADPDINSLKKQMRFAYENYKDLRKKAITNSEEIRKNWTWENTAKKLLEALNES
jgi:glycosyltransferase involved in cell wall biosynthesis